MGRLTTHILDTASGRPAQGVEIVLFAVLAHGNRQIAAVRTNEDGRVDGPIAEGAAFAKGEYELVFHLGAYFDALGLDLPEPKFLDTVVLRFGIAEPDQHYHVPLLVSPYGYSTYRGS
ncbi:5-hydroxyisourate hydrolase [hydrothermal vent metagenome]|uniref:hydroxyisourate hydrolase n=1 Tax=hydrothermal vent metagenome TaxID=652676 RepID=A0A3B0SY03_9ZZZZ